MSGKKYKRGVTVGAFDLCHAGHILMFNKRDHLFSTTELRNRIYEQEKVKRELINRENNS